MAKAGSDPDDLFRSDTTYTMVAAIDFGTTFSGYSCSFKTTPEDIFTPTTWGEVDHIASAVKTPTCVLTDAKGKFVALGYEARVKYRDMEPQEAKNHRFYTQFKMKLHTEKKLTTRTFIKDQCGFEAPAMDIFAMVLRELKRSMVATLKYQTKSPPVESLIRWVITVPAIWTDGAKQFMREAAVQAGLVDQVDSCKLILALEPEAASIFCQGLPLNGFDDEVEEPTQLTPGTKYLVLDAGGGTLDITAHKILPDNKIEELYIANGGPMGGARVNDNFLNLLDSIFGEKFIKLYKMKNPSDFNHLVNLVEAAKKAFDQSGKETKISMTLGMLELFQNTYKKDIRESISPEYTKLGVAISNGILKIPHAVMESVFKPVLDDITSHVEGLFKAKALRGVRIILMVGGFSSCKALQHAIRTKFPKHAVLVPREAWSAVMRGAVRFGHESDVISARVARMTYGYNTNKSFQAAIHDPEKVKKFDGEKKATNVFIPFVKRGESIKTKEMKKTIFHPVEKDQTALRIRFFQTLQEIKEVMYTDEKGMDEIGSVTVDLPGKGLNRKVELSIQFGGTEIKACARDMRDHGHTVHTTLDFLSKQNKK